MTAIKVISLEGLGKFKELLGIENAEKFADKKLFSDLLTDFAENYAISTDEQVNSMLDEIFATSATKISGYYTVATDGQVDSMLDEIFG